ncbi:hypothetical protein PAN31117_05249 [Pandoraea anapnoica]|uniref:Uncharacterized protein n=1 Tax=Pandoraea anapnoica TaxID=2508301 RepID=A0A5E5AR67_9BURK|nr:MULTISPECIES: hypothetical protein [Pandoraea]VVE59280.1 hypothetical protein PIN31009_05481 [Pandoraea iniqua]VVE75788.1 hypothetical protein PAN31117_05249 [Pandoraea anapnoica]
MSRSKRKTPICGVTSAVSEAEDKALWHRAHRRSERVALERDGIEYIASNRHAHSSTWRMGKDGKHFFDAAEWPTVMRK